MTAVRKFRFVSTLMPALASLFLLHGCSTAPITREATVASGESAYQRGQYEKAAQAWQKKAMQAEPDKAGALWISAADAWVQAGRPQDAEKALRWVERSSLSVPESARLDLVLADLALRSGRADEAEILLQKAGLLIPAASKQRYDGLYARLIEQLSSPSARDIAQAARKSDDMAFYNPSEALEMMQILESVSSGELAVRAFNPRAERRLTGWLDLALVIRSSLVDPVGAPGAVEAWKNRHPHHPLSVEQALETRLLYRQGFRTPGRVAVILPDTGRLQAVGAAVKDGLLSAYAKQPGGTELLFFGTGDDPQSSVSAYFSALDAGVDWIIGPLRRESVEAMLGLAGLATPVLALNDLPVGYAAPEGLEDRIYALSLSQEAEARAAALHAAASGLERAIVLAPESPWGERMAAAFEAEFLRDDRQIVAASRYLETQNDHGTVLQRALQIDESKARKRQLENTLQVSLEFEAVRRQDVDVIFLAANARHARLIRPQLRFHDAGDIPVYATGRIFSGVPDPARNRDLDGIRFPTTLWHLEHSEHNEIPEFASLRSGGLGTFFALGMDAWNMLPWLGLMNRDPGFRFPGTTGYYFDSRAGTLLRNPVWGEFSNGRPASLNSPITPGSSH